MNHMTDLMGNTYDGKSDQPFTDWITLVEKIGNLTPYSALQLAIAKAEGIVYKCIEGIPKSLTLKTMKKRLCQLFSPVAAKMHAATADILDPWMQMKLYKNISKDSETC